MTLKDYFDEVALQCGYSAVLVPRATRIRNLLLDKCMTKVLAPVLAGFENKLILDIGCGIGRWGKLLSSANKVVGIDVSFNMTKIAKKTCHGHNSHFVVADAAYLPFRSDTFDIVMSITVLQHILRHERCEEAISELVRCGRSDFLIMEEMWSTKEILLEKTYCPTRISPIEQYLKKLDEERVRVNEAYGATFAPLSILLVKLFAEKRKSLQGLISPEETVKLRLLSKIVHLLLAISVLPAIILPRHKYNPKLSLHTIVFAKKKADGN